MNRDEIQNMDEETLFNDFLKFPGISHSKDRERFVLWAINSRLNCTGFTAEREAMLIRRGFSKREIMRMRDCYEWLDNILEVMR